MALGELQDWSWATSGCSRRFIFVCLSYACKALLKSCWRLEDEEAVERASDMMVEAYDEGSAGKGDY
jgi:hypothetical protein